MLRIKDLAPKVEKEKPMWQLYSERIKQREIMARLKEKTVDRGPVWKASGAGKMKEFNSPGY